eukprot:GHVL01006009.1.p1 GENE.GHVL01006009.1~~GHVL01006009.1.p1  ORF type:complete len:255 (+),score=26.05 GHVL01006009.1:1876-2640(+)
MPKRLSIFSPNLSSLDLIKNLPDAKNLPKFSIFDLYLAQILFRKGKFNTAVKLSKDISAQLFINFGEHGKTIFLRSIKKMICWAQVHFFFTKTDKYSFTTYFNRFEALKIVLLKFVKMVKLFFKELKEKNKKIKEKKFHSFGTVFSLFLKTIILEKNNFFEKEITKYSKFFRDLPINKNSSSVLITSDSTPDTLFAEHVSFDIFTLEDFKKKFCTYMSNFYEHAFLSAKDFHKMDMYMFCFIKEYANEHCISFY